MAMLVRNRWLLSSVSRYARITDIVVLEATSNGMPVCVKSPRYMCCVKCCEVGRESVFDTGAVRIFVPQLTQTELSGRSDH